MSIADHVSPTEQVGGYPAATTKAGDDSTKGLRKKDSQPRVTGQKGLSSKNESEIKTLLEKQTEKTEGLCCQQTLSEGVSEDVLQEEEDLRRKME